MRDTMERQPADLRQLLADWPPIEAAAARLAGRRTLLVGTGTSWHAAHQGAFLLRLAGIEAWALQAADAALYGPSPARGDALVLLSHRGTKRYTSDVLSRALEEGVATVAIGGKGAPGVDVETVEQERSSTFTASHLGALARLAQLAVALGADLDLTAVPDAVAAALAGPGPQVEPPARGLEFTGAGPNQWTAAEGALKVREAARVFAEGLSVEQLLHGPSAALQPEDTLVCLDGGGPGAERLDEVADAVERGGTPVHRIREREIGEALSIFPLTVAVQRIALECSEERGTDPDDFRPEVWKSIAL